jgi:pilus assembly protein Flp/PilA
MKNQLIEWYTKTQSMLKDEKGATMVEYALMVALIAVVCIGMVTLTGTAAKGIFEQISTAI